MGTVSRLADYSSPGMVEVYAPVNYRPPETCHLYVFPEGSRERRLYSYEAVQWCSAESATRGLHIVELPEGRGMYWTIVRPDGLIELRDYYGDVRPRIVHPTVARVLGRVFQWIPQLDGDERIELIRGPAVSGVRETTTLPLYEIAN